MSDIKEFFRLDVLLPLGELFMGSCSHKWYRKICQMQNWSHDEIIAWQNDNLRRFVEHAYNHTVYYRRLFDSLGIKPNDIQNPDDLTHLPILTKDIVNAHYDEFVPDNISKYPNRKGKTGGTTGKPMLYLCDENTWGYVTAAKMYYWKRAGYHYGDKFIAFGSASLFGKKPSLPRRIYDKIRNEIPLNSVNLDDKLCDKYTKYINSNQIRFIYGYSGSLFILSQYILRNSVEMNGVDVIFTTSETLTDEYRDSIEKAFKCKVVDCYGARDAGISAYETTYHRYKVGYNVIIELENEYEPNRGVVLTTNFLNYSFPLIRYRYGDEVELEPIDNTKDYNGRVITNLLGRTSNIMHLGNGHNLTSTGFAMIMKEFDIVAFDFNQIGELAVKMRIQPVVELFSKEQESQIKAAIKRYIGEDCVLEIEYVEGFDELPNGKRNYFMNIF